MTLFLSFGGLSLLDFFLCSSVNLSMSIAGARINGRISTSCGFNVGIELYVFRALPLLGKEGFLGVNTVKLFQAGGLALICCGLFFVCLYNR